MAYIGYNKLWESEFDNLVSKRYKVQYSNIIQLKLEVHDSYKKDEKIPTNVEPVDDEDVTKRSFPDKKISKTDGNLSLLEKDYNEFKLQYNKQSVERTLIEKAVKTTMQIHYDKKLFDSFHKTDEVLQDFLFSTRPTPDLKKVNDVIH